MRFPKLLLDKKRSSLVDLKQVTFQLDLPWYQELQAPKILKHQFDKIKHKSSLFQVSQTPENQSSPVLITSYDILSSNRQNPQIVTNPLMILLFPCQKASHN